MANISIYLNDAASKSNSEVLTDSLLNHLYRHQLNFRSPKDLDELEENLKLDVQSDCEYIFSVGGDGTANTILQNIQGSDIKLMVIPTGTANDFASELGINLNIEKIIKIFQYKSYQTVDIVKINGKYMVSNGGIGLTSNVAQKINDDRKKFKGFKGLMKLTGSKIYPLYFGKELLKPLKTYRFNIQSKDYPKLETTIEASIVMINNQAKIGGNFLVAPNTKNDDGKFNVTILTHTNRADLMNTTLKMYRGEVVENDPSLISFETDKINIMSLDEELVYFGDGEILAKGQNFEIESVPNALNVCSYDNNLIYCNSLSLENLELM